MRILFIIILLPLLFCKIALAKNAFTFHGQVINPICLAQFNSSLSEVKHVTSINLDDCQQINQKKIKIYKGNKGGFFFDKFKTKIMRGYYGYKVIGRSSNGVYVVETFNNIGGTGTDANILLLKLVTQDIYVYKGNKHPIIRKPSVLTLAGYIVGGDRCMGGFKQILLLRSNKIRIKQYINARHVLDCSETKKYYIDLNDLHTAPA